MSDKEFITNKDALKAIASFSNHIINKEVDSKGNKYTKPSRIKEMVSCIKKEVKNRHADN